MTHRILLPLDGSDLAEQAVGWADVLAGALGAEVELLEVLPLLPDWEGPAPGEAGPESPTIQQARGMLHRASVMTGLTLRGSPAETIADRAHKVDATLIVMSSHGRGGLGRAVLGSVAGDVLRLSHVPVLVVPAAVQAQPRVPLRALFPLDESTHARSVFEWAAPLSEALGWTMILCGVADLPQQGIPIQGATIPLPAGHIMTPVDMSAYLEGVAADLRSRGHSVDVQVGIGDPATLIAETAVEASAEVIVMSTHSRHGLARWALGSITETVIQRAGVPVLACHPMDHPPAG